RLSHLGGRELPRPPFDPSEQRGSDPAATVRWPDIALTATPVDLGVGDELVALKHQQRIERGIETLPPETDGDVVHADLGDAVGVELARGDQLEDRGGVRRGRRAGGQAVGQLDRHEVLHPGQRSPPTGPGSVSAPSSASRTSSNVSQRRYGTPSCSQIATSSSFANTRSEYSAPSRPH